MQFMKLKEENIPTQVAEDTIIFTDHGNIYVSTTTGTLLRMGSGESSGGEGNSVGYAAIMEKLVNLESILNNESSAFYRPKMITVPEESIVMTKDYLSTSSSALGQYVANKGGQTISYVVALPPNVWNIMVTRQIKSSRFLLATFDSLPVDSQNCIQYVRDFDAMQLGLSNITEAEKYLVIYVTNTGEEVPVAINLIARPIAST